MKRLISIVLCCCIFMSSFELLVFAADEVAEETTTAVEQVTDLEDEQDESVWTPADGPIIVTDTAAARGTSLYSNGYHYIITGPDTCEITGCEGTEKTVVIPSQIDGYKVTSLGEYIFYNLHYMRERVIPDSVKNIGNFTFYRCYKLEKVTLPEGLLSIGEGAFSGCSALKEIKIPKTVKRFGANIFEDCTALENKYSSAPKQTVTLGQEYQATIEIPDLYNVYYTFIPSETRTYAFKSSGNYDTVGYIYDSSMNLLATDDNGGENKNFTVSCALQAGEKYILAAGMFQNVGSFTVKLDTTHEFTSQIINEATCTENGLEKFSCKYCDHWYTDSIPYGHTYSGGKCTRCGKTETYTISATTAKNGSGIAPATSNNYNALNYKYFFANTIKSHLVEENGGYTRVEYNGGKLLVETYDKSLKIKSKGTVSLDLPIYGGVYICDDYNFVVTGQNNPHESDSVEVFRVTRYTKDWKKQGYASLFGGNTVIPFDAGSLRFARAGDVLYVRTAHEMYTYSDGLNHQANLTMVVDVSDMTMLDAHYEISNRNHGYISHSFNQFIIVDGNELLALDHGDAIPRSIIISKYRTPAGKKSFSDAVDTVEVLKIANNIYHYNFTGVSLGGFDYSDTHYLVAGNTCAQTGGIDQSEAQRNIFVTYTDKNNFTEAGTRIIYLTTYAENAGVDISNAHLVKILNNKFCVIWSVEDTVYYCMVDGMGNKVSKTFSGKGKLSDCVPIVDKDKIIWYATDGNVPVFYQINLGYSLKAEEHSHIAKNTVGVVPGQDTTGQLYKGCSLCDRKEYVTLPAISSGEYNLTTVKPITCTSAGKIKYTWKNTSYGTVSFEISYPATGHNYLTADGKTYTCANCGDTFTVGNKYPITDTVTRIKGKTRYETSLEICYATKERMGVDKFGTIIIASGENFADALAGSYLAKVKGAPILMTNGKNNVQLKAYISANLAQSGTVYILGGTAAVPQSTEDTLIGFNVKRLKGKSRYETNIEILKEAGVTNEEIIVATGTGFADSLSASAAGKPILLVDGKKELTQVQKDYLGTLGTEKFYIVGGTGAVAEGYETALAVYGSVERVKGRSRYETSVAIAEKFFANPDYAVIAYAENFPDGLCGGPLAMTMDAPLILTKTGKQAAAKGYMQANGITSGVVLGGASLIDDATAKDIFGATAVIVK